METVATGLLFPEGPVALRDGSVLFLELGAGTMTRVFADGARSHVADLDGGPNGAAIGPDGAIYVCNNGGGFDISLAAGKLQFSHAPHRYIGGSIQRVELDTGAVSTLYEECEGIPLTAPNDLVFDATGGFWFTDHGRGSIEERTFGAIYYARPQGGEIRRLRKGLLSPNGIGISPDGRWLYWADTFEAQLWRAEITEDGMLAEYGSAPGEAVARAPGDGMFDSLALEADGRICIGTVRNGGITVVDPVGSSEHIPLDDDLVTNVAFGGADGQDVWITASGTGRLLRGRWPRPGHTLAFSG